MPTDKPSPSIDEKRLRQYEAMRPVAKGLLITTARVTAKLMLSMIKFAFRLPGAIRRASDKKR